MKEAFENNMLVFRKCKKLNSFYLLFQKIFLLITGGSSLIGGIAAFVYTGNIISLPLLLILWGLLLLFHANLSQRAYQVCLAFMVVVTLFAKSTDNIFFNEEIFGFLSQHLIKGSLLNFAVMFFIVYNIIKTACNPDLFGLFSPRLRHLLRYRKQIRKKSSCKRSVQ